MSSVGSPAARSRPASSPGAQPLLTVEGLHIHFPVRDRESWKEVKAKRLDDDSARYPADWDELVNQYRARDYPLGVNIGSLIGVPRNLIGFENICMMVCEEPEFLEEIVEDLCQAIERNIVKGLREIQYDYAGGWEDICYNSGPIVRVSFFRDVVAPAQVPGGSLRSTPANRCRKPRCATTTS